MQNAIRVINPYLYHGTWVFDDADHGLVKEPFVAGIPAIIDLAVSGIKDAGKGFRMLFSGNPFPGHTVQLNKLNREHGGCWYQLDGSEMKGWLCPAMFHYFSEPPESIYVAVEQSSGKK